MFFHCNCTVTKFLDLDLANAFSNCREGINNKLRFMKSIDFASFFSPEQQLNQHIHLFKYITFFHAISLTKIDWFYRVCYYCRSFIIFISPSEKVLFMRTSESKKERKRVKLLRNTSFPIVFDAITHGFGNKKYI